MILVCGPGAAEGRMALGECWARVGDADGEIYPLVCRKPVDPEGIGLCDEHLALYREDREEPAHVETGSTDWWLESEAS